MNSLEVFEGVKTDTFQPPFIIAEVGVNHEGSMDTAKRLIDEACEGGADAVKFQTYKAETLAAKNSPSYWDTTKEPTTSQFALFKKHDKFWKSEFEKLKIVCDERGIEFMSTPFDLESAGFLNDLMNCFKISSSDITNKPFIEHLADFKKPIILSTGASDSDEISDAVSWVKNKGVELALLHCVLSYPTSDEFASLGRIQTLKEHFTGHLIGYSDHTLPKDMEVCYMAGLMGARIIEKHFTHDKSLPGNDHYHAMDMHDLKILKEKFERASLLFGSSKLEYSVAEENARDNARRSLVLSKSIKNGEVITSDHLTWKRPASGISPKEIENVIGKSVNSDLEEDTILTWNDLVNE